jgi:zinc protease
VVETAEQQWALANGARVIFVPDESTNLVNILVRVEVGAKEDPPGKAGLAHLVEHLLFETHPDGTGTATIGRRIAESSIYSNAFTSSEATDYVTVAGADRLDRILALEARQMAGGCAGLDERKLGREREVVKSEIKFRRRDTLDRIVSAAYPDGHAYGRSVVGGRELDAVKLDDVCRFVDAYYVPGRTSIVITGGTTRADVDRALRPFAELPARPGAELAPVEAHEVLFHGLEELEVPPDTAGAIVVVGSVPPVGTPGHLLAMLAFDELERRLPQSAGRAIGGVRAPRFMLFVPVLPEQSYYDSMNAIFRAAARVRDELGGLPLELIWTRLLARLTLGMDSPKERAGYYAERALAVPDAVAFADDMRRIETLDLPAVRETLTASLGPAYLRMLALVPAEGGDGRESGAAATRGAGFGEDDEPIDAEEAARPVELPPPARPAPPGRAFRLSNGLRVHLVPQHAPFPVVTVTLAFGAGTSSEPARSAGVATLAATSLTPPTGIRNVRGFSIYLESELTFLGATFDRQVLPDLTLFSSSGLGVHAPYIVKALAQNVRHGTYATGWRERGMSAFAPESRVAPERAAWRMLLGDDHPYARLGLVAPATLAPDDPTHLEAFRQAQYTAAQGVLVVAGSFDVPEVEAAVRKHLDDWPGGTPAPPVPPPSATTRRRVGIVAPGASLVSAMVAFATPAGVDEHYVARHVLGKMLDHRIQRRVRAGLAAAYAVEAGVEVRRGPGMLLLRAELDEARAADGVAAMLEALASLRRGEGFDLEFARARRQTLRDSFAVDASSSYAAWNVARLAIMGPGQRAGESILDQLSRLRAEDVRAVLDGELTDDRGVVVLRGPREVLVEAGAKLGGLELGDE